MLQITLTIIDEREKDKHQPFQQHCRNVKRMVMSETVATGLHQTNISAYIYQWYNIYLPLPQGMYYT